MDDNSKQASSFQLDQEILDARGIKMTVAEVASLSKVRYSERVQSLKLSEGDSAFLKGLRRRIKNRLASQNSRRRSVEHLRRLTRELRAVRACKGDAVTERSLLQQRRAALHASCGALHRHIVKILQERSDPTAIPVLLNQTDHFTESQSEYTDKLPHSYIDATSTTRIDKDKMASRISAPPQSIEHKQPDLKRIVCAKTVFLNGLTDITRTDLEGGLKDKFTEGCGGVLNLSVKCDKGRRNHGRKQSAPRRIVCAFSDYDDSVLDLKIKKEN